MGSQIFKFLGIFFLVLFCLAVLSILAGILPAFNFSEIFIGDISFIIRLLIFTPFALALSILFMRILIMGTSEPPAGLFVSLVIILIFCMAIFELLITKQDTGETGFENITTSQDTAQTPVQPEISRILRLKNKINKTLDSIYYTGDYNESLKILIENANGNSETNPDDRRGSDTNDGQESSAYRAENVLIAELIASIKVKMQQEETLIETAKKHDPDFMRGFNHLINKKYFYAERYFRNNLSPTNRYFLNKSLALLQRQGQQSLEENFQDNRRKNQMVELGIIVEKKYPNAPRTVYEYYNDMYVIYGDKGLTNALSKYAQLISVDEITDREIENLRTRDKKINLVFLTTAIVQDKSNPRQVVMENVILFIKRAYFMDGSQTVYFKGISFFHNNRESYEIEIARIDRNKGIFKNFTGSRHGVFHNGILTLGTSAVNIIHFQSVYPAGKKLSIFFLMKLEKTSLTYKIFRQVYKEKLKYYIGLLLIFALTLFFAYLVQGKNRKPIKKVFWILPILILFIFSFIVVHFSYFIMNALVELIV